MKTRGRPNGSLDKKPRKGLKLTPEDVSNIRKMSLEGSTISMIRETYKNVSRQNIHSIIKNKTWKSVTG